MHIYMYMHLVGKGRGSLCIIYICIPCLEGQFVVCIQFSVLYMFMCTCLHTLFPFVSYAYCFGKHLQSIICAEKHYISTHLRFLSNVRTSYISSMEVKKIQVNFKHKYFILRMIDDAISIVGLTKE